MTLTAAADGSALGNPGPAGWGWYIDEDRWDRGGWAHGTNNMGELTAVLDLLQQTAHLDEDLHVICDSKYVINSITAWMPGWKRKGWRKKDGKPVLNVEIMQALDAAMAGRRVTFEWVRGHTGHALNEDADRLATSAAAAWAKGAAPEPGPGIPGARSGTAEAVVERVAEPAQDEPLSLF
ncbi:ribonuclease HI [Janibacter cremeus]|uniref:ribonuclease H family protein n=1 Tax=Janibacter cremeus TaxID=1285192 RepID=UPI0023F95D9E|nr:ribonuclease H [Janibacter cremeus]WEV79676.1 ribonuclease HI [Janibacter cremeus]